MPERGHGRRMPATPPRPSNSGAQLQQIDGRGTNMLSGSGQQKQVFSLENTKIAGYSRLHSYFQIHNIRNILPCLCLSAACHRRHTQPPHNPHFGHRHKPSHFHKEFLCWRELASGVMRFGGRGEVMFQIAEAGLLPVAS